ncbi:MAG: gamma carbonic anhydrase family protein [Planctomycetes bacterium]|nr:gamma carbonic anhydrase family protein [Planctomycetota bacterium]MCB9870933.1 gamma carbonic anhydrase family protein [Planctomycetota bacterium]MCB9888297.1 gamma carbonic anhydrase family protein [Planctomycetota bacterium]
MVGRLRRRGSAMVADNATVLGDVHLGRDSNIWFGVTIRADDSSIHIGERTNIQDNSVIHVDLDAPHVIGDGVTVGHGVILHGVEIGDYCLIGMGSVVLSGARIGEYCIIGAGALVPENAVIPAGSLVVGLPAKVKRQVTDEEKAAMRWRAAHYVDRARSYLLPCDLELP